MTLKQLLSANSFPQLSAFVERLQLRASAPHCVDSEEARALLDEINHLATRALKPATTPSTI